MKKILFIVLFCTCSLLAEAQSFYNNSTCTVMIQRICYTACNCQIYATCFTYDVLPGANVALSTLNNCCNNCDKVAYRVCFVTGCPGVAFCMTVSDNTLPACYAASATPTCGVCFSGPASLGWLGADLYLQ